MTSEDGKGLTSMRLRGSPSVNTTHLECPYLPRSALETRGLPDMRQTFLLYLHWPMVDQASESVSQSVPDLCRTKMPSSLRNVAR